MSRPYCIFAAYLTLSSIVACCNATAQEPKPANKKADEEVVTQTVIAEGSGSSEDEALKSAFRVAVQQVVGAVVSVETLVKDDAIIEDKILTYSDGFIEKYDELPGSKTVKAGIHRIRIKTVVQRKNLVAKLKAANVAMFAVDGSAIFAEAVSKLQSEKDAKALLEAAFEGFPESCVKASVVGKPMTIDKTDDGATLVFKISIEPDLIAYKAFQTRLAAILEKMANQPGEFSSKFQQLPDRKAGTGIHQPLQSLVAPEIWKKTLSPVDTRGQNKSDLVVAIATSQTTAADRVNFRYFPIEGLFKPIFDLATLKQGRGNLKLINSDGESIAAEDFDLDKIFAEGEQSSYYGQRGNLVGCFKADRGVTSVLIIPAFYLHDVPYVFGGWSFRHMHVFGNYPQPNPLVLSNKISIDIKIKLSFQEIKSISDAKVQIGFD